MASYKRLLLIAIFISSLNYVERTEAYEWRGRKGSKNVIDLRDSSEALAKLMAIVVYELEKNKSLSIETLWLKEGVALLYQHLNSKDERKINLILAQALDLRGDRAVNFSLKEVKDRASLVALVSSQNLTSIKADVIYSELFKKFCSIRFDCVCDFICQKKVRKFQTRLRLNDKKKMPADSILEALR